MRIGIVRASCGVNKWVLISTIVLRCWSATACEQIIIFSINAENRLWKQYASPIHNSIWYYTFERWGYFDYIHVKSFASKYSFWSLKQFVGCHDVDIKALKILCQRQLSPTSHSCLIDYINLKTWSEPVFQCLSLQNSCTCHFDKHRVQKLNWSIVILSVCLY